MAIKYVPFWLSRNENIAINVDANYVAFKFLVSCVVSKNIDLSWSNEGEVDNDEEICNIEVKCYMTWGLFQA